MDLNKLAQTEFSLDIIPGGIPPVVHASQGDIDRRFVATIKKNGAGYDVSDYDVVIRGKKPDGTVFEYEPDNVEDVGVVVSTTEQMTIIPGPVACELVFSQGGTTVATANFILKVEGAPYDPDALSESDVQTLGDLIEQTIGGDIRDEVDVWLDEHPEATTTVQDGTITDEKLNVQFSELLKMPSELDMGVYPFATFQYADGYRSAQGMTAVDEYGLLVVVRKIDDNTAARLFVIDADARTLVSSGDYLINHGNNLAYANGKLYSAYFTTLYEIPISSTGVLGEMETYTISRNVAAVVYDETGDRLLLRGVEAVNGDSRYRPLFALDLNNLSDGTLATVGKIDLLSASNTPQGMHYDGKFIYQPVSGASTDTQEYILIQTIDGNIEKKYSFPKQTFFEIEDVSLYNGGMFINFNAGTDATTYHLESACFYVNFTKQPADYLKPLQVGYGSMAKVTVCYCEPTEVVNFPYRDSGHPFGTVQTAVHFAEYNNLNAQLSISGTYAYDVYIYNCNKRLLIDLNGATMASLQLLRNNNVSITSSNASKIGFLKVEQGVCNINGTANISLDNTLTTQTHALQLLRCVFTGRFKSISTYDNLGYFGAAIVNVQSDTSGWTEIATTNSNAYVLNVNGTLSPSQTVRFFTSITSDHIIATASTYENVNFGSIVSNVTSDDLDGIVTVGTSGTGNNLTFNKAGYVKVTFFTVADQRGGAGKKYTKIQRSGSATTNYTANVTTSTNQQTAPITNIGAFAVAKNDVVAMSVYGAASDRFVQTRIEVEFIPIVS